MKRSIAADAKRPCLSRDGLAHNRRPGRCDCYERGVVAPAANELLLDLIPEPIHQPTVPGITARAWATSPGSAATAVAVMMVWPPPATISARAWRRPSSNSDKT